MAAQTQLYADDFEQVEIGSDNPVSPTVARRARLAIRLEGASHA